MRIVPWQRFSDLAPYLYAADVLIIPPSLEPLEQHGTTVLPIKLFLYLAAGRAILAPIAPDTAELLRADANAALVPPGDIDAMLDMLRRLIHDVPLAERLGAAALETARDPDLGQPRHPHQGVHHSPPGRHPRLTVTS